MVLRFYTKNLKSFQLKIKAWRQFFPNFDLILNRENQRHAFIFAQNDLKFFV